MKLKTLFLCLGALLLLIVSCRKQPAESEQQQSGASNAKEKRSEQTVLAQTADIPVLQRGIIIEDGDKPLTQGSAPEVADWNNDGKKDLLAGDSGGKIHLYLNMGTDAQPVFKGGQLLKANNDVISVGAG